MEKDKIFLNLTVKKKNFRYIIHLNVKGSNPQMFFFHIDPKIDWKCFIFLNSIC